MDPNTNTNINTNTNTIKLTQINDLVIIFTPKNLDEQIIIKIMTILDKLLNYNKKFGFIIDTRETSIVNKQSWKIVRNWMKDPQRQVKIKEFLLCSVILLNNKIIATILSFIFKIQKPISPNFITSNFVKSYQFINNIISIDFDNFSKELNHITYNSTFDYDSNKSTSEQDLTDTDNTDNDNDN